ncbi:hypothetical protein VPH35_095625 [Triticum aestivum]
MDSPRKKAGSTTDGHGERPHLLPAVSVTKKATASRTSTTLFPDAVRLVGIWALCTACLLLGSFTLSCALGHYYVPGDQCVEGDVWIWIMCAALQAAAAALALLLPGRHRRVRRALGYLALAAAIVGHCMLVTSAVGLALALNPEPYLIYLYAMVSCTVTIVFLVAGDLVSFLALLLALGGED